MATGADAERTFASDSFALDSRSTADDVRLLSAGSSGALGLVPSNGGTATALSPATLPGRLGGPPALSIDTSPAAISASAPDDLAVLRPGPIVESPVRATAATALRTIGTLTPTLGRLAGKKGAGYQRLSGDELDSDDDGDDVLVVMNGPAAGANDSVATTGAAVATGAAAAGAPGAEPASSSNAIAAAAAEALGATVAEPHGVHGDDGFALGGIFPKRLSVVSSILEEAKQVITVPPLEKQHAAPVWSPRPEPVMLPSADRWTRFKARFQPDQELLKRRLTKRSMRMSLMAIFSGIMVRLVLDEVSPPEEEVST